MSTNKRPALVVLRLRTVPLGLHVGCIASTLPDPTQEIERYTPPPPSSSLLPDLQPLVAREQQGVCPAPMLKEECCGRGSRKKHCFRRGLQPCIVFLNRGASKYTSFNVGFMFEVRPKTGVLGPCHRKLGRLQSIQGACLEMNALTIEPCKSPCSRRGLQFVKERIVVELMHKAILYDCSSTLDGDDVAKCASFFFFFITLKPRVE